MRIRIKGKLPDHVKDMGVKVNQRYHAEDVPWTRLDAKRFIVTVEGEPQWCTVLPKNYAVIK